MYFRRYGYNGCWLLCGLGVIVTKKDTLVVWSTKKLAIEYDLIIRQVGALLRSVGAEKWSKGHYGYDSEC